MESIIKALGQGNGEKQRKTPTARIGALFLAQAEGFEPPCRLGKRFSRLIRSDTETSRLFPKCLK
ncbi:MAG: hypothetical protein IJW83_00470 [Clostridia bacterium]|nr:hypothetical protein [Clostridia bacterium]